MKLRSINEEYDDEYEGLDDEDEFTDEEGGDPFFGLFANIRWRRGGVRFNFGGDEYIIGNYNGYSEDDSGVFKNGEKIGREHDHVPLDVFTEAWWNHGYGYEGDELGAPWSWYELREYLQQNQDPEGLGGIPPGVPRH